MDIGNYIGYSFGEIILSIILFIAMTGIGSYLFKKLNDSSYRYLNPEEFLPVDEIHTLKQIFYLIMMALCFANVFYSFITVDINYSYIYYFIIFDVVLSLYIAITMDKSTWKNRILVLLLVPYGSLTFLMSGFSLASVLDFIHLPIFIYFVKYYFDRFMEYTDSNGLGVAIILLFAIIFFSFLATQITEHVNPLDSLVMVSNAFTSNGYAVLGHSIPGKINSLFLVWGGYIISGAGTATLTAAILIRQFNKRFRELEKLLNEEGE